MEVGGRHALPALLRDRYRVGERLLDVAARLCRDEPVLEPRREVELPGDLTLDRRGVVGAALDKVPLVDSEHEADIRLERVARNVQILSSYPFGRIREQDGNVGALERADRTE